MRNPETRRNQFNLNTLFAIQALIALVLFMVFRFGVEFILALVAWIVLSPFVCKDDIILVRTADGEVE